MSYEINVKPIKGDIIRVKRKLGYYHFGIYIGNNQVIHYSAEKDDSIFDNTNIKICLADLEEGFLRGDVLEVNIPFDSFFSRRVIVKRAKNLLGTHKFRGSDYDLLNNNCEHVARYCYYGDAVSAQSEYMSRGVMGVVSSTGVKVFNHLGKRYREKKNKEAKNKK
ncbi:MAG: lecithin retinol acyltransferase family protein [Bacilli bacterium]|nr:lecithin retinol acyltransferase family protein [Bacilli bacterium]